MTHTYVKEVMTRIVGIPLSRGCRHVIQDKVMETSANSSQTRYQKPVAQRGLARVSGVILGYHFSCEDPAPTIDEDLVVDFYFTPNECLELN